MAYYFGEEDKDQAEAPEASKASSVIAGGNAAPASPTAPSNASVNNARTNPGNFVGVSQYLDANKPQAAGLANKVGGVITGSADAARSELGQKVSDANSQIQSNTVGYDQNAINQLKNDASKADINKIETMKNASYKGPDSLGDIGSLAQAQQNVSNIDSEEGRKSLIGNLYNDQPLKKGSLNFDNLLLQAAPESKDILANAKNSANITGLESDIGTQKSAIEQAAANARAVTQKTAADTQGAIGQARSGFEGGLQSRVDALRNQSTKDAQGALDRLKAGGGITGQASARDLEVLGITQDQYQRLLESGTAGALADKATIRQPTGINAGNVANADDYARYNVLKRLAGGGDFLGNDASQAGKYNSDLLDFNYAEPPALVANDAPQLKEVPITQSFSNTGADVGSTAASGSVPARLEAGVSNALKKLKWK